MKLHSCACFSNVWSVFCPFFLHPNVSQASEIYGFLRQGLMYAIASRERFKMVTFIDNTLHLFFIPSILLQVFPPVGVNGRLLPTFPMHVQARVTIFTHNREEGSEDPYLLRCPQNSLYIRVCGFDSSNRNPDLFSTPPLK